MTDFALRSRIAHFREWPNESPEESFEYLSDGVLAISGGRITFLGSAERYAAEGGDLANCEHQPSALLMAGFIDAHVHAPQLSVIGSFGKQLLDWLENYTFPAELRFGERRYSEEENERFVRWLLAHGVTSAMVFSTAFKHSADHLFQAAERRNMRLLTGKVWMDRNAPPKLCDTTLAAREDSLALIERWHNKGRLGYVLTPRFAGTSSREQLQAAGELLSAFPDLWLQTHLSENCGEVAWTRSLFPEARDYLDVYEQFGLHHRKSLFAHCIYLSESEIERIAERGSAIGFCPSSNLFLGSGLFDYRKIAERGIAVALASDVGAGTSLSPFQTLADAYKVCQLQGISLSAREAFYLTSLGAARALKLDSHIGNLAVGKEADFIMIDPGNHTFIAERLASAQTIDEELFVYMTLGDERLIERTYVAGVLQYNQKDVRGQRGCAQA